jgi:23S rRNA (adenine2503-C2)-methyltransferase
MSRYDLSRADLAGLLEGEPTYRVDQVWEGMYRRLAAPDELTELPRKLRAKLAGIPGLAPAFSVADVAVSDRGLTLKWSLAATDGTRIETVLMGYRDRVTVCVSSQAGCAMACGFCATGQGGYLRQLSSGEITEQVVRAARFSTDEHWGRLGNIVLMGMGEPLANYANVRAAIGRWNQDLGIGARSITLSTVGIVPGIRRLTDDAIQVNLAVSLHAANDELRSELVPINRRYPLGVLMEACGDYVRRTHRRISFEWACIAGVNDGASDAAELAGLARPLGAHVNLIPLNPTPGYLVAGSTRQAVAAFRDEIAGHGVNVTVRHTRGRDLNAACGQLAGPALAISGRLA